MFLEFTAWLILLVVVPLILMPDLRAKELSIEAGKQEEGHAKPRRHISTKATGLVKTPSTDVRTLYDILKQGVNRFPPNQPLFGSRSIIKVVEEEKEVIKLIGGAEHKEIKKWKFPELSGYSWMSVISTSFLYFLVPRRC